MKKVVSLAIMVVIMFAFCATAFAETTTYVLGNDVRDSKLLISGTTATCKSSYTSNGDDVVKVVMTQSLQKQGFLWIWGEYDGGWTKTSNGTSIVLSNTLSGLPSGSYRVKTVFTVTDKNGNEETTTLYSTTEKVS